MKSISLAVCFIGAAAMTYAEELKVTRTARQVAIPGTLIVGRAVCSDATWLLFESHELVQWRTDGTVKVQTVTGFTTSDRLWGLACLSDGTLWTLAAGRTLARIGESGRIQERVDVRLPRVALFGAGNRLLFQQLPIVPGTPALMTSPPRQPYGLRSWPGLVVKRAKTRESELAQNLANCGIPSGALMPCWFTTAMEFTISDGVMFRTIDVTHVRFESIDREAPIRDVALAESGHFWLLAAGPDPERRSRAGVRLSRGGEHTKELLSVDLRPAARTILTATKSRCLLLALDGSLIEVVVTP